MPLPQTVEQQEQELATAGGNTTMWIRRRDELIRQAVLEHGWTVRRVAGIVGMGHSAVHYIVKGREVQKPRKKTRRAKPAKIRVGPNAPTTRQRPTGSTDPMDNG